VSQQQSAISRQQMRTAPPTAASIPDMLQMHWQEWSTSVTPHPATPAAPS
jgi:hypothetical protein